GVAAEGRQVDLAAAQYAGAPGVPAVVAAAVPGARLCLVELHVLKLPDVEAVDGHVSELVPLAASHEQAACLGPGHVAGRRVEDLLVEAARVSVEDARVEVEHAPLEGGRLGRLEDDRELLADALEQGDVAGAHVRVPAE